LNTIGQVLERTLKRLPNARKITGQVVMDSWPQVVGGPIAEKTRAVSFENGLLWIQVRDSVWSQHLSLQKKQIISKLNRTARTNIVQDLRFVTNWDKTLPETVVVEVAQDWRQRLLEAGQMEKIERVVQEADLAPDLAQALKKMLVAQEKRILWYRQQGYPDCRQCGMPVVTAMPEDICLCCKNDNNG
jgi:hypothetical protein